MTLYSVNKTSFTHLNVCTEMRCVHKLADRGTWVRNDSKGVDMRGRGAYRGNERQNAKKEGVVFACGVLLTPSNSNKQRNLCGQETPQGLDMCSY